MMLNDIEEFLKKIKEFKESKEFKKHKEILDLIDTVDEVMKRYYDIINPKPKIVTSDGTHHPYHDVKKLMEEIKPCEHVWVLKNSHTYGEDYQCSKCGAWKTVNWDNDFYEFDVEYYHSDKVLGC